MESLKPQDILVLLKICVASLQRAKPQSMAVLGIELGLSASEVHAALRRLRASGLLRPHEFDARRKAAESRPNATAIAEFLVHGLKYVFPARHGELTRGVATSYAALPFKRLIAKGRDPIPVWPYAEGRDRGTSFEPLYRTVPYAALRDPELHQFLAVADALRDGRARERKIAETWLRERLKKLHVD